MPPIKSHEKKQLIQTNVDELVKSEEKPQQQLVEDKDEDRIDFVNVKDLIKGMERQKNKENAITPTKNVEFPKETNGFLHKKITDNGHDNHITEKFIKDEANNMKEESEKIEQENESEMNLIENDSDKFENTDGLSRSNSLLNGTPLQPPKPLPRSSISEPGSGEEQHSEVPKPKPRTTTVPISGYKVWDMYEFQ